MITFKDENDIVNRGYVKVRFEDELRTLKFGDYLKSGFSSGNNFVYIIQKANDCESYKVTLHSKGLKLVLFTGCMEDAEKIVEDAEGSKLYDVIVKYLNYFGLSVSTFRKLYDGGILNIDCVDYYQSDYEEYETFCRYSTVVFYNKSNSKRYVA